MAHGTALARRPWAALVASLGDAAGARLPSSVTHEQARASINAADTTRDRRRLECCWQTGGRVSEVLPLRPCAVNRREDALVLANWKQRWRCDKRPTTSGGRHAVQRRRRVPCGPPAAPRHGSDPGSTVLPIWYHLSMATHAAPEPTVSLTLRLPRSVHAAAVELAAREDRTLNNLVVHLLRREAAREHEWLLREAIAQADRGEGTVVTAAMRRRLRVEIEAGTEADEALSRAGI
jgi:integrase